jgi:excisionase family DNA binding protein
LRPWPRVPGYLHTQIDRFAALVLHGSGALVSPKEAVRRLGIKVSTVYRLCAKDALPHMRFRALLRIEVESVPRCAATLEP